MRRVVIEVNRFSEWSEVKVYKGSKDRRSGIIIKRIMSANH